jgi:Protein of unknown function (DUF3551)
MTTTIARLRRSPTAPIIVLGMVLATAAWDAANVVQAGNQTAPWCASQSGRGGGYDCSYYTFEQCMATARGLGGSCAQNPVWIYGQEGRQRRPRK